MSSSKRIYNFHDDKNVGKMWSPVVWWQVAINHIEDLLPWNETARLLPRLGCHDALDDVWIAAIVDEELPDAAFPGPDVSDELLQVWIGVE